MVKMPMFSIENISEDEYLVQINLDILIMPKLIYKTFYCRLMYIRPDRVLKTAKDIEISINRIEVLKYHCEFL